MNRLQGVPSLRDERGQSAFEFVLVLPIFIMFVLLVLEFGILMYEYVSVSNAAREGARFAAVNCESVGSCDDDVAFGGTSVNVVKVRAAERSGGIVNDPEGEVTVTWIDRNGNTAPADRGDSVVVKVDHAYEFLFLPFPDFRVLSCSDMRLEQQDVITVAGAPEDGC